MVRIYYYVRYLLMTYGFSIFVTFEFYLNNLLIKYQTTNIFYHSNRNIMLMMVFDFRIAQNLDNIARYEYINFMYNSASCKTYFVVNKYSIYFLSISIDTQIKYNYAHI